jgi:uncharacterized membrane protein YcaP (DUF421 family)
MDIVLRATVMFAVLVVLLRLLGKRELAEVSPFELVVLVVLGDLIQQGITHNDFSLSGATLAIVTFAFWSLVLSWVSYKWRAAEKVLEGTPLVLVQDGKLLEKNLKHDRLTKAEVESEMRNSGISHIEDVAWAILEPQGKLSFIGHQKSEGGAEDDERPET